MAVQTQPTGCCPSLTLGIGQQPYSPLASRQQVVSSGHWDRESGQITEVGRAAGSRPGDTTGVPSAPV